MENWNVLRPLLREKFGKNFYFYNDMNIGYRRIKIMGLNDKIEEIKKMGIDVKPYKWKKCWMVNFQDTLIIKCVI